MRKTKTIKARLASPKPQNKGYGEAGASVTRRATKGFTAKSGSPTEDIDIYNRRLRQRSRMLYMSSPVATSAIKTNRTNVIGVGLQLKSNINRDVLGMTKEQAEEWQKKTETEWALWATNKRMCDATGVNDFYEIQQLALVSWLVSGDVFGVLKHYETTPLEPYSLRVHLVEADRIATPTSSAYVLPTTWTTSKAENGNRIYDGVEIDKNGAIVAYYIRSTYPYESTTEITEWTRVEAYGQITRLPQIVHVMDSERPDQYRGVSYLAQIIEPLLQLRRYTESELTAAVIESFFTAFITTKSNTSENPLGEMGASTEPQTERVGYDNDYELGPGAMNVLAPGEDVAFADPKRPAGGFDAFVRAICGQIGAALEIPADLLLKNFNASYSASRAALLEAWKAFKMRRVWFTNDFCRPIYEAWLDEAVARGRIDAPGFFSDPLIRAAYLGSDWIGPSQGMLDPTKEITAETLAVAQGFSTREQSTKRLNGGQWESNIEAIERENEKLAKANAVLNPPQTAAPGEGEPTQQTAAIINAAIINSIKEATKNE